MFNSDGYLQHPFYPSLALLMVMLVSSGTAASADRYILSSNGQEVTDTQTRLVWRRCAEGLAWNGSSCAGSVSYFSHEDALEHGVEQATATAKPWRLPNVKELASILSIDRYPNPAIDTVIFPSTPGERFWSSSPNTASPGYAWSVDFYDGVVGYNLRYGNYAVRLVRQAR